MHVGERRLAIRNGLNFQAVPPPELRSGDPNVVAVEVPDEDHAYLNAMSVGSTRVYYMPPDAKVDKGFKVTVVP
jgi:hypothetical protein